MRPSAGGARSLARFLPLNPANVVEKVFCWACVMRLVLPRPVTAAPTRSRQQRGRWALERLIDRSIDLPTPLALCAACARRAPLEAQLEDFWVGGRALQPLPSKSQVDVGSMPSFSASGFYGFDLMFVLWNRAARGRPPLKLLAAPTAVGGAALKSCTSCWRRRMFCPPCALAVTQFFLDWGGEGGANFVVSAMTAVVLQAFLGSGWPALCRTALPA